MDLLPDAEQEQLGTAVRDLLADGRAADPDGTWTRLGRELDVLGLVVPEALGGAGAGQAERAVVAQELGRALSPVPFLGSAVLAVDTLLLLDDEAAAAELLPGLARGEKRATVAVAESGDGGVLEPGSATAATADGPRWRLHGVKEPVVDALGADVLLVLATAEDGPAFFRVDAGEVGLAVTQLCSLDLARPLARITFDGASAHRLTGDASAALAGVADRAALALGAEQVGGMTRAVELTLAYVKDRHQFGRPIGSYQAVKHQCADMYVAQELSTALLRRACWAADHAPERFPQAARLLAAHAGPAFFAVARSMVQLHGGLGYTWEHEAHRFYRRGKADRLLPGSPARHRARLADLLDERERSRTWVSSTDGSRS